MKHNSNSKLPASGHDICNYFARHGLANFQIQAILKLDGKLDPDKLLRAVKLSVESEPVLGCRFVEGSPPYWRRMDRIHDDQLCSIDETDDPDTAIGNFTESILDMDKDPNIKTRLIRSADNDTLCIKINHACCDGAGVKEYIRLLSEIYSAIDRENGEYSPEPRVGGRKDQDKLFDALGIKQPIAGWQPLKDAPVTAWAFPWRQGSLKAAQYSVSRLPQGILDTLSGYGRRNGATINDLILTSFYRALFKISQPPYGIPMDIITTIDLRRYIPGQKTEAIRNFSGGFKTSIARIMNESFEETLSRVIYATKKAKAGLPGLQNARSGEFVEILNFPLTNAYFTTISRAIAISSQIPFSFGNLICAPGLSNLAFISRSLLKFGGNTVTDAYILPPAIRAPGLLLLVSTYNGIITLSAGYYKGSLRRSTADGLLKKIKAELMKCRIFENE